MKGAPLGAVDEYGSLPQDYAYTGPKGQWQRPLRQRLNVYAICFAFIVPWLIFAAVSGLLSFTVRHLTPTLAWGLCLALFGLVALFGFIARTTADRRASGDHDAAPNWFTFLCIASSLGWFGGVVCGNYNFSHNMRPFYNVEDLNTYVGVDPSTARGPELMDAGRAMFTEESRLDLSKSMGFRSTETYCVAPVTMGESPLATYDFWAVGVNCCSGNAGDFHCGQFNNPHAGAGLRLMNDEQRSFYRLAVQQAEAAYQIQALHPVFFIWMEDPVAEMQAYQDDGFRFFLLGLASFFVIQFALTIIAAILFSKVSDKNW